MTRFYASVLFLLSNLGFCIYNWYNHEFPTTLLYIFMGNMTLYIVFYLFMKVRAREYPRAASWIFLTLFVLFGAVGFYHFFKEVKDSNFSPAKSKQNNQPCSTFEYFDFHDMWHLWISFALFFLLMFLLTLDDDLDEVNQSEIQVW